MTDSVSPQATKPAPLKTRPSDKTLLPVPADPSPPPSAPADSPIKLSPPCSQPKPEGKRKIKDCDP